MRTFPLFHYTATVLRVIDGDTAVLRIDRGFREYWEVSCRLWGANAPELATGEPGQASKAWLAQRIVGKTLFIKSEKLDKYGRPVVTLYEPEPVTIDPKLSINEEMITLGFAVPYLDK